MLFTRDLRVHDNPALAAACEAEHVVPAFVFDDAILAGSFAAPNRVRFLRESLADLRTSLRMLGGDLVVRRGDPAAEVARLATDTGADSLFLVGERSAYGTRRLGRLCDLDLKVSALPGITVVPPGDLTPATGDHYRVFTPYWRAWDSAHWRPIAETPTRMRLPVGVDSGELPTHLASGAPSPASHPAAKRQDAPASRHGGTRTPPPTNASATISPPTARPGSPPTSSSAASHRWRWRRRARTDSGASSRGATSTIRSPPPSPHCPGATTGRADEAGTGTRKPSLLGGTA